jgi:hypothetical protein
MVGLALGLFDDNFQRPLSIRMVIDLGPLKIIRFVIVIVILSNQINSTIAWLRYFSDTDRK